jgi:hypothetical protein
MERRPVPAHPGTRQLWCPGYSRCLDHAIRQGWEGSSCEECPHRNKDMPADPDPMHSITALVWSVLYPARWRRFLAAAEALVRRDNAE